MDHKALFPVLEMGFLLGYPDETCNFSWLQMIIKVFSPGTLSNLDLF